MGDRIQLRRRDAPPTADEIEIERTLTSAPFASKLSALKQHKHYTNCSNNCDRLKSQKVKEIVFFF